MHFGNGWLLTFAAIFVVNTYLLVHLALTDFKRGRFRKTAVLAIVFAVLMALLVFYFNRFFGGDSYRAYMRPLAYIAGFYMCLSFYSSGIFFFSDTGRGIIRLIRRIKSGRPRGAEDEELPAPDMNEGSAFEGEGVLESPQAGSAMAGEKKPRKRALPKVYSARFTLLTIVLSTLLALAAFYTPGHITVTEYALGLPRRESELKGLRVAFISDSHIGPSVREKELDDIVEKTNALNPDIVLLGGDIVDEGTPDSLKQYMSESFSGFKSKYGTYFIMGNHDDYRGDREKTLFYIKKAGIRYLLDETVLIDGKFYLIGRDDRRSLRVPLQTLEAQATQDLPVILFDHRPVVEDLRNSEIVELQLSGHTHDGQIFPFHVLDPFKLFSPQYGLYEKGGNEIIVSSGVGEYAVPSRLGSPSEIVFVDITFE
ncbi:MAG: metallophosphoesterase [Clostridiales Family XIII bacterium]|nr:metallophosphoesterase [Clostridiales Family XIII bacterium]